LQEAIEAALASKEAQVPGAQVKVVANGDVVEVVQSG
jgi:hypothetical protein